MLSRCGRVFVPPSYHFHRADWDKLVLLQKIITGTMVQNRAVDEAVLPMSLIGLFGMLLMRLFPKHPNPRKLCKPWWNASSPTSQKGNEEGVGYFQEVPHH
ncbi:hypothetical protein TNCV_3270861 [Trichonephila clavipes]|nr:hypothetical protein TNCV_3270861 [Trichonephila clavipes]